MRSEIYHRHSCLSRRVDERQQRRRQHSSSPRGYSTISLCLLLLSAGICSSSSFLLPSPTSTMKSTSSFIRLPTFQPYLPPLYQSDPTSGGSGSVGASSSAASSVEDGEAEIPKDCPSYVQSPVLRQVYSALLEHREEYGNPNIPLGSSDGRKCKTLRRLHIQKKLTDEEIELLELLGFRFNSLEDVYEEADFEELLGRLIAYEKENQTNYQIPKKYPPDPELGAWVTGIRRLGPTKVTPQRRQALDDINFAWVSTRKCGSSFMKNYRSILTKLEESSSKGEVLSDESVKKWINAQREVYENGNLSKERVDYMDKLGVDWREPLL